MKHTPGPWHRNIRANGKYPVVFAGRNTHVALVQQAKTPDETEANIDLVAAAPELLEALERAARTIEVLKTFCGVPLTVVRAAETEHVIEAAIAKARGS